MKAICANCKTARQYDRERAGETVPCTICGALMALVEVRPTFAPPPEDRSPIVRTPFGISIAKESSVRDASPLPAVETDLQHVIISGINLSFKDLLRLYWFFTLAQALVLLPFALLALLIYFATR